MYSVYILQSKKNKSIYVGYSSNIKKRVEEHQKGGVFSTREMLPVEIIYCELYKNKKDAIRREQYLKTGWGRNYIRKILKNTLDN